MHDDGIVRSSVSRPVPTSSSSARSQWPLARSNTAVTHAHAGNQSTCIQPQSSSPERPHTHQSISCTVDPPQPPYLTLPSPPLARSHNPVTLGTLEQPSTWPSLVPVSSERCTSSFSTVTYVRPILLGHVLSLFVRSLRGIVRGGDGYLSNTSFQEWC